MTNEMNMKSTEAQVVADIRNLMAGWNKIEAAAKIQFPNASKEELYKIVSGAMNHALGWAK